jgi:hypothetical protein
MRAFIGSILGASLLVACGGTDPNPEPPADEGLRLASFQLKEAQSVSFYEVPEHGVITVVKAPRGTPMLDKARLDELSAPEAYRVLSGQEPPAALVQATLRMADPAASAWRVPEQAPEAQAAAVEGVQPGSVSQLAAPDAAWFSANFCTGLNSDYDSLWCPTNSYSWAHSGWGPLQKFYQVCGTTADTTGTLWLERWSNGAWQRIYTGNLTAWQWACASIPGVAQYRSGIDAAGAVLYSERYRYAIPSISAYLGDFPNDRSYENFYNDIQGITHDANNWYLTHNDTNFWKDTATNGIIGKQTMTNINGDPPIRYSMPSPWYSAGFRHYGDLVQANGLIYVAMDNGSGTIAGIGVFNTDLAYIGFNYLPSWSGGVAFIAYNSRDGLFYAVTNDSGATVLKGYQITVSGNTVSIVLKRSLTLMSTIPTGTWIQGGKISSRGNLYVSVGGGGAASGIYMIDVVNGFVQTFYPVGTGAADEFEGLDLWNLDADQRIGAYGQIHLQQINIDVPGFADDYWLAHFRVDDPSKL